MSEENVENYCVECGEPMPQGSNFCPACGAIQKENNEYARMREERKEIEREVLESRLNMAKILLVVYAIPAIFAGAYSLIFLNSTVDMMFNTPEIAKIFADAGMSWDFVHDYLLVLAILTLAGGVLAGVSAYFSFNCRRWVVACVCCLTAAIFALPSIFGCIIGLLVSWMVYQSKELFTD